MADAGSSTCASRDGYRWSERRDYCRIWAAHVCPRRVATCPATLTHSMILPLTIRITAPAERIRSYAAWAATRSALSGLY